MGKYDDIRGVLEENQELLRAEKDNFTVLFDEGRKLVDGVKRHLNVKVDSDGRLLKGSFLFDPDEFDAQVGLVEQYFNPGSNPWAHLFFAERAAGARLGQELVSWRKRLVSSMNAFTAVVNATIGFKKVRKKVGDKGA